MTAEQEQDLKAYLALVEEIREHYPEGEFDREMLHGDMDFRYRRIKELREKLAAFPPEVRKFGHFVDTAGISKTDLHSCLRLLLDDPDFFTVSAAQGPGTLQKRCAQGAEQIGLPPSRILTILAKMRMHHLLDRRYRLAPEYRRLCAAFLAV